MFQKTYIEYPIASLPESLRNVILETQATLQAPIELIASAVLSAIAHASQHAIDIRRGNIVTPVSLYTAVIADSGERKSTVDKLIMQANRTYEKRIQEEAKSKSAKFEATSEIWEATLKGIQKRIKHAVRDSSDTDSLRDELEMHRSLKPVQARFPKILYADTTMEAMLLGLHQSWPSALLLSAEGATVLSGQAIRGMDKLNVLWDGGDIPIDRIDSGYVVRGARLTTAVMIQSKPFLAFLERRGDMARGLGFLARCLITYPKSTQGSRFISGIQDANTTHLPLFHARITEMLNTDDGQTQRKELKMSAEAFARWQEFYNCVERELADNGLFADTRDFASKIADNAARIAAIFHNYQGRDGFVGWECVNSACEIATWYAFEFKKLFGTNQIPQEEIDAQMLEAWLWKYYLQYNNASPMPKQRIRTYGPSQLRHASRLTEALFTLARAGKISLGKVGKTEYVFPNLQYLTSYKQPLQGYQSPPLLALTEN